MDKHITLCKHWSPSRLGTSGFSEQQVPRVILGYPAHCQGRTSVAMRPSVGGAQPSGSGLQNKPCDSDSKHKGRPAPGSPAQRPGPGRRLPGFAPDNGRAALTWRCRPRKTTAKAPCPTRSRLLYSKSPTTSMAAPPGHRALGWAGVAESRDQHRGPEGPKRARGRRDGGSHGPGPGRTLMPRGRSGNGTGRRAEPGSARPGPGRSSWPGPPSAAGLWPSGLGAARPKAPPPSLGVPGATRAPDSGAGPGPRHPRRCGCLGLLRPRRCCVAAAALEPAQPRWRLLPASRERPTHALAPAAPRRLPAQCDVSASCRTMRPSPAPSAEKRSARTGTRRQAPGRVCIHWSELANGGGGWGGSRGSLGTCGRLGSAPAVSWSPPRPDLKPPSKGRILNSGPGNR